MQVPVWHVVVFKRSRSAIQASANKIKPLWRALGFFVMLVLVGVAPVFAEQGATEQACLAKSYVDEAAPRQLAVWPQQLPAEPLDAACWVAPQELSRQFLASPGENSGKATLIDVRVLHLIRRSPVSGAIQVGLSNLESKRFLQEQDIVLVGAGLDYADLSQTCLRLKKAGFQKVRALLGGAPAWLQAQENSEPNQARPSVRLRQLDADEWIASFSQGVRWSVLSSSGKFNAAQQAQWPVSKNQVIQLNAGSNASTEKDLGTALDAFLAEAKPAREGPYLPKALIMVADSADQDRQRHQLQSALAQRGNWPQELLVYWLEGGWTAYQAQVAQAQAIQQTANHRLQLPCGRL